MSENIYETCTYVAGFIHNTLDGKGRVSSEPAGHVEVGGSPDVSLYHRWVAVVKAERDGWIGYKILENEYPGEYHQIGKALTRVGAERKVNDRLCEIVEDISNKHGLPIVDFDGALGERKKADTIICDNLKSQWASE